MWACGEGSEEKGYAPGLVLMYCWDSQRAFPRLSWDVLLLNHSSDRTLSYVSYKLFTVFAAPHILERAVSFTVRLLNVLLDYNETEPKNNLWNSSLYITSQTMTASLWY